MYTKLIPILFIIGYAYVLGIPAFLKWKLWVFKIWLLVGFIALMPIMYCYIKYIVGPIEAYDNNPRLVEVKANFDGKDTVLNILISHHVEKFDSGDTVIMSKSFWSNDFRLKDLNFELFRDKSVLHGLNDITLHRQNRWSLDEGLYHGEEADNHAVLYEANKKVIVIHDPKED